MTRREESLIAEKLLSLAQAADAIDAPNWTSPSTRKEVAAAYEELLPMLEDVKQLMDKVRGR